MSLRASVQQMGLLIGIVSGLLWGLNDVVVKEVSLHVTSDLNIINNLIIFSLALAFIQDLFSCVGITSYHLTLGDFSQKLTQARKIIILMIFAGIFAGPLGMVAGIMGISYAGPVYAGVITSCYPVIALILSIIFIREKANLMKILGIILSVTAVIFISIQGEASDTSNIILGMIFATVAMFGWGAESVLFAYAYKKTLLAPSFLLAFRQFSSATSYLIILIIYLIISENSVIAIIFSMNTPILIFICACSAMFSYITYYNAIKFLGPSLGTVFNASFIFWAAIWSLILGIESVYWTFWIWGTVLLIGMFIALNATQNVNK
ncbi:DMT family transporter [Francisellaceae bacterium]|nr:DMT family transporter [Francisellaceae bacterium]